MPALHRSVIVPIGQTEVKVIYDVVFEPLPIAPTMQQAMNRQVSGFFFTAALHSGQRVRVSEKFRHEISRSIAYCEGLMPP